MYERAGLYFESQKDDGDAQFYLEQALSLYEDWGCHGKVEQMMDRHPFLAKSSRTSHISSSLQGRARHEKGLSEALMRFSVEDNHQPTVASKN